MTEQELQLIDQLFQGLRQQASAPKDVQADAAIRQLATQVPDATYLLTQRSLLLEQALQQAQQQIAQLQSQVPNAGPASTGSGSFLSGNQGLDTHFGRNPSYDAPASGMYAGVPAGTPAGAPNAAAPAPSSWRDRWFGGPTPAPAPMAAAPQPGGSGFLGQAAASAAGVAGGMLLFNGLNHMLGNTAHAASNGWDNNSNTNSAGNSSHQGLSGNDNAGLDQLAQEAGRDHVDTSRNALLDDSSRDDDGDGGDFSDGGSFFDDDNFA